MPTLSEWLEQQEPKITQEELGRRVSLTQGRISQIVRNGTSDLRTALEIERATGGEVTVRDLLMQESAA